MKFQFKNYEIILTSIKPKSYEFAQNKANPLRGSYVPLRVPPGFACGRSTRFRAAYAAARAAALAAACA